MKLDDAAVVRTIELLQTNARADEALAVLWKSVPDLMLQTKPCRV